VSAASGGHISRSACLLALTLTVASSSPPTPAPAWTSGVSASPAAVAGPSTAGGLRASPGLLDGDLPASASTSAGEAPLDDEGGADSRLPLDVCRCQPLPRASAAVSESFLIMIGPVSLQLVCRVSGLIKSAARQA
jgi:hypothetical protein